MFKLGSLLGFVFGLGVLFAAYMGTQESSVAETPAGAPRADGCVTEKVALDEGYGVTRTETHLVCPKTASDEGEHARR